MADHRLPIIWSPEALANLTEIWRYTPERLGRKRPTVSPARSEAASRLLEEHPPAGRLREELRPGLRSIAAKPHVVFYRVASGGVAEIVRVLHGRRDIDAIFADDPSA